jgi:uncharacterized protein YndB with AHSA1/START domain
MSPIKEIEFKRSYDVPIEVVWKAWTDPEILKQWWGPNGVVITECKVDLCVGGRFYIVMEAGEAMGPMKGTRWPMEASYTKIEPHVALAYTARAWTEGQEATTELSQISELTLSHKNGSTTLYLKAALVSAGPDATMAIKGMQWGYTQQLEKLSSVLKKA